MLTTSFGHSIRRNQHCINLRSHLGSAVSFVLNQLQKYDIRDYVVIKLPEIFAILLIFGLLPPHVRDVFRGLSEDLRPARFVTL